MAMYQLMSKVGKLLFHRLGVMLTLIAAQIAVYVLALLWLRDTQYYGIYWGIAVALSVLSVLWTVGNPHNPGSQSRRSNTALGPSPFG